MDSSIWSCLQSVRAEKIIWEFAAVMPGMRTPALSAETVPVAGTVQLVTCSQLRCQQSCWAFLTQVGRTLHTPVAMATDWEEPSRSCCCQGRICQSKKLSGERWGREERAKSTSEAGLWEEDHGRGRDFWLVAKQQGIEKEHFSAMYIQMNVWKSPLNILGAAVPYLLGEVIHWRRKLFCECWTGARDQARQRQDMPGKLPNLPGSGTMCDCQERLLDSQWRYRYLSLACHLRICRKSLPLVCIQLSGGTFGIVDQEPVHQ